MAHGENKLAMRHGLEFPGYADQGDTSKIVTSLNENGSHRPELCLLKAVCPRSSQLHIYYTPGALKKPSAKRGPEKLAAMIESANSG